MEGRLYDDRGRTLNELENMLIYCITTGRLYKQIKFKCVDAQPEGLQLCVNTSCHAGFHFQAQTCSSLIQFDKRLHLRCKVSAAAIVAKEETAGRPARVR